MHSLEPAAERLLALWLVDALSSEFVFVKGAAGIHFMIVGCCVGFQPAVSHARVAVRVRCYPAKLPVQLFHSLHAQNS